MEGTVEGMVKGREYEDKREKNTRNGNDCNLLVLPAPV